MKKNIVFVGRSFMTGDAVINLPYQSRSSLLDGDIVVVSPDIESYNHHETYQGKPCLGDDASFNLTTDTSHWRSEITAALAAGRTVIVFLHPAPIVFVATGDKKYSGTGRNVRTTRIVTEFDPYSVIPGTFGTVVRKSGERIKPRQGPGPLAAYWKQFGEFSSYGVYIDNFAGLTLLETVTGNKTVGGVLQYKGKKGKLVFLPVFDLDGAVEERSESLALSAATTASDDTMAVARRAKQARAEAANAVVAQLFSAIIDLDKVMRNSEEATPTPAWADVDSNVLPAERKLRQEITDITSEVMILEGNKSALFLQLDEVQKLKGLLYENGPRLEQAVLLALRHLGFKADGFKQGESEFDALFIDPLGRRFLGEAEGRDDKSIGIEKLDQLERNIREDFKRQPDGSSEYAQGVLFGNAHRLISPSNRPDAFTNKCLSAAQRSKVSLIRTADLFIATKHLLESGDLGFAASCRDAIANGAGTIVSFPELK